MDSTTRRVDIALIGAGIMSATLGALLRLVRPGASIALFERLDEVALESSDPWNNAGTGHAALCELHYTPERADGTIDVSKALLVNDQFQLSLQFYSWLVTQGIVQDPSTFIRSIPHVGIAWGDGDVAFLKKRFAALDAYPQFSATEYSEDRAQLQQWLPLVMEGRDEKQPIAATRHPDGTDVNFGSLTRQLVSSLESSGVDVNTGQSVRGISRESNGDWRLSVEDRAGGSTKHVNAGFVFVGAGGTAIHLLQQSQIAEIRGVGGFPVSGQFLRCTNPELIDQHRAKVYGRPAVGAPPMTAPHLDTRVIDDKRGLMFGPFAGFTPKFLKEGSVLDLPKSVKTSNILTLLNVGRHEIPLTTYLMKQILMSKEARVDHLRGFMPRAKVDDWELIQAGQRVQVMRPVQGSRGVLKFGTEVITAADGSIAGLLGASPGASTATAIMLDVMERCFPNEFMGWSSTLREAIPSIGVQLEDEPDLYRELERSSAAALQLNSIQS